MDTGKLLRAVTAERDMTETPAFDVLAKQLSEPLQRYLQRFVGDPYIAEDLLQETLIRISRGLRNFEGRSSSRTWAYSIATRVAIDHSRRNRAAAPAADARVDGSLPDEAADVEERLIIDEMNACIREEIDSLPGDYRAAIVLHDLEGLTAAETAAIVGCSLDNAKVRIHRARQRLKKALERDCTFYYDSDQTLRCDRKCSDAAAEFDG